MKRRWKILLWALGIVVALMIFLVTAGPSVYGWMMSPNHDFGEKPIPEAPDYALRSNWSGWPDNANPAERLPTGVTSIPQEDRLADAFFLHPTTYGGKDHWVQPMDYEPSRYGTDHGTTSIQASVFNGCCRVYAPRFRQANLGAYTTDEVRAIMDIGFEDVRKAFRHFLATIDPDSPIVLGSHSQGSSQMVRLVMEEIDGTPLIDRLVAIYAIGHSLPSALVEKSYQDIEVCTTPTQTGCFITWDAHEGDKKPSHWSDKDEQTLWNGRDYTGYGPSPRICVNPITWRTDSSPSDKKNHLGALPRWTGFTELDASLGELVTGTVSAYCADDAQRNWLFVNGDRDPELKVQGFWSLFARNLHGSDYSLFWANIRENALLRSRAFIEAREAVTEEGPNQ